MGRAPIWHKGDGRSRKIAEQSANVGRLAEEQFELHAKVNLAEMPPARSIYEAPTVYLRTSDRLPHPRREFAGEEG